MEKTSIKWHEIINKNPPEKELPFLDLYREYAQALHERETARQALPFWPART